MYEVLLFLIKFNSAKSFPMKNIFHSNLFISVLSDIENCFNITLSTVQRIQNIVKIYKTRI